MKRPVDRIFIDLDETLISSYYLTSPQYKDALLADIPSTYQVLEVKHPVGRGITIVVVRPWAKQLIQGCFCLVGEDQVYILTRNSNAFTQYVAREVPFGIAPDKIFSREDLHYNVPMFKHSNNILIDNESHEFHSTGPYNKVDFLHGLKQKNLIQVDYFIGTKLEDPDALLNDTMTRLKKILKTR